MKKIYQKDKLKVFLGFVDGTPQHIERNGNITVMITLRDEADEHIKIYFRNNAEKKSMLANRVVKAKVHDGSLLAVMASCDDPEEKSAAGIDFCFSGGMLTVEKSTILIGKAFRFRMQDVVGRPKNSMACVSMQARRTKDEKQWISISFFDGEYNGRKSYNASNARKALSGREDPLVAVVGGAITDREKNGTIYHNMYGYQVHLISED